MEGGQVWEGDENRINMYYVHVPTAKVIVSIYYEHVLVKTKI